MATPENSGVVASGCPFCGCSIVNIDGHENVNECYVQCTECEATGAIAATYEGAMFAWEQRVRNG